MNSQDNNSYTSQDNNDSGIDKFDGSFEKEESGCTILVNETVNMINDFCAAALYMYLMCRPPAWKLNVKQLASKFNCNKDKIYHGIDTLISLGLLTRKEFRQKGKFEKYSYRVHLKPINNDSVQMCAPCLEKPEPVKPDTENPDAYKTKNIINKEKRLKHSSASGDAPVHETTNFDLFWSVYPIKKNKIRAQKIWDKNKLTGRFDIIYADVADRIKNDHQWQDIKFIPHPSTYLVNELWNDDVQLPGPSKPRNQSADVYDDNDSSWISGVQL